MQIKKFQIFESDFNETDVRDVRKDNIETMFLDIKEDQNVNFKIDYKFSNSYSKSRISDIPLSEDYYMVCVISIYEMIARNDEEIPKDKIMNYYRDYIKILNRLYTLNVTSCKKIGNTTQLIIKMSDGVPDNFFAEMRENIHKWVNSISGVNKMLYDYLQKEYELSYRYENGYDIFIIPNKTFKKKTIETNIDSKTKMYVSKNDTAGSILFTLIDRFYQTNGYSNWLMNKMPTHTTTYLRDEDNIEIIIDPKFKKSRNEKV